MQTFITENFLLQSETAKRLYFEYVKNLPIIDYHNHLSPEEIASDKKFETITEAWLNGDHYKWRAMRANGIDENLITGDANDYSKFKAWAATVPYTMRNPLYHWTHLELKHPFDINELLNEESADRIYNHCNGLLQTKYSVIEILNYHKVELLCTTDSPTDDLYFHQLSKKNNLQVKMLPTFRPDVLINFSDGEVWFNQLQQLSKITNSSITNLDDFLFALQGRIEYFHNNGCRLSDHGLEFMPAFQNKIKKANKNFEKLINKQKVNKEQLQLLKGFILFELCKLYDKKNWTQQFHLGSMRNNNSRLLKRLDKMQALIQSVIIRRLKNYLLF